VTPEGRVSEGPTDSYMAEGARFENPSVAQTTDHYTFPSVSSQSLTEEFELGEDLF